MLPTTVAMLAIDANRAMMIIFGIEKRRPVAKVTDELVEILNRSSGGPTNVVDEYSVDPSILNGFAFVSGNNKKNTLMLVEPRISDPFALQKHYRR